MSNDLTRSMYGLYAGGQFKAWSMPVAEARAIVGVPHTIDSDGEDQLEQDRAARAQSNKRSRSETASMILSKKRSNLEVKDVKEICSFCGDSARVLECCQPQCKLAICVEKTGGQMPCIIASTLPKDESEFWCPTCCQKARKPTPYIMQVQASFYAQYQENMPLAVYTLTMDPPEESYVANVIINQFQEDFRGEQNSFHLASTQLANGEATLAKNGPKMKKLQNFLKEKTDANFFLSVQETLSKSSALKGLFLMACGTTFTNDAHFAVLKGLVESNTFSFVFGFRGFSVIPRHVMCATVEFMRLILINRVAIWDACLMAFTANPLVLQHSPLVIIYCQDMNVVSRTLVYSQPKDGVWGITPICTDVSCLTQPGEVFSKTHKVKKTPQLHCRASWTCKRCQKNSDTFDKPDWVIEVPHRMNFFFYDYPFESEVSALATERTWRQM